MMCVAYNTPNDDLNFSERGATIPRGSTRPTSSKRTKNGEDLIYVMFSTAIRKANLGALNNFLSFDSGLVNRRLDREGNTPLYLAACAGKITVCAWLLHNGANINLVNTATGSNPLHAAADRGHVDIARILISAGIGVNRRTYSNEDTALHLAAYRGHVTICDLLLRNGADWGIVNKQDRTPLDEARASKNLFLVKMFRLWIHNITYEKRINELTILGKSVAKRNDEIRKISRHSPNTKSLISNGCKIIATQTPNRRGCSNYIDALHPFQNVQEIPTRPDDNMTINRQGLAALTSCEYNADEQFSKRKMIEDWLNKIRDGEGCIVVESAENVEDHRRYQSSFEEIDDIDCESIPVLSAGTPNQESTWPGYTKLSHDFNDTTVEMEDSIDIFNGQERLNEDCCLCCKAFKQIGESKISESIEHIVDCESTRILPCLRKDNISCQDCDVELQCYLDNLKDREQLDIDGCFCGKAFELIGKDKLPGSIESVLLRQIRLCSNADAHRSIKYFVESSHQNSNLSKNNEPIRDDLPYITTKLQHLQRDPGSSIVEHKDRSKLNLLDGSLRNYQFKGENSNRNMQGFEQNSQFFGETFNQNLLDCSKQYTQFMGQTFHKISNCHGREGNILGTVDESQGLNSVNSILQIQKTEDSLESDDFIVFQQS